MLIDSNEYYVNTVITTPRELEDYLENMDLNGSLVYEEFTDMYTGAVVDEWAQSGQGEG